MPRTCPRVLSTLQTVMRWLDEHRLGLEPSAQQHAADLHANVIAGRCEEARAAARKLKEYVRALDQERRLSQLR